MPIDTRDRAVLLVGLAAAMRCSELSALDVADVAESGEGLRISFGRSKTDQEDLIPGPPLASPTVAAASPPWPARLSPVGSINVGLTGDVLVELEQVVLWNARYLDAIVEHLREGGQQVRDEDIARLSPLGHAHLNCLGRCAFTTRAVDGLRPLRDPSATDDTDGDW
jgi:hypothetical protein